MQGPSWSNGLGGTSTRNFVGFANGVLLVEEDQTEAVHSSKKFNFAHFAPPLKLKARKTGRGSCSIAKQR